MYSHFHLTASDIITFLQGTGNRWRGQKTLLYCDRKRTVDRHGLSTLFPLMQWKALYHILLVHNMYFILLQDIPLDLCKREIKYTKVPE